MPSGESDNRAFPKCFMWNTVKTDKVYKPPLLQGKITYFSEYINEKKRVLSAGIISYAYQI